MRNFTIVGLVGMMLILSGCATTRTIYRDSGGNVTHEEVRREPAAPVVIVDDGPEVVYVDNSPVYVPMRRVVHTRHCPGNGWIRIRHGHHHGWVERQYVSHGHGNHRGGHHHYSGYRQNRRHCR